jgi:DNA (cytosine-5)-methyltransferase 1
MGYHRAGFEVVGVDIEPQPHYPFEFIQADALEILDQHALLPDGPPDAIHASPPCQEFTVYRNARPDAKPRWPNLIPQTRRLLESTGLPWVIENVPGAPLRDPVQLCGTAFGIRVRRHRLFEADFEIMAPPCAHGRFTDRPFPGSTNRPNGRTVCNIGEYRVPLDVQKRCMEIDWPVTLHELSEAIPPAYTAHVGHFLLAEVKRRALATTVDAWEIQP